MKTVRALILTLLAVLAGAAPTFAQSAPAPAAAVPPVAEASAAPAAAPAPAGAPAEAAAAPAPAPEPVAKVPDIVHAAPTPGIGQPTDSIRLQTQMTPIGEEAVRFHDIILVPMMVVMSVFVLLLLIWVVLRYRAAANPTPSRTSHNTVIEVIWTLFPVLVLVSIAVPSIRLLAHQYHPPKADLTVKVIGNQWYWTYQYPDNGDFEVVSNLLKEKSEVKPGARFRTDADGPRLLAVDERMVVPAGAVVKVITTSNDVIHSFAMPAFWVKMDAIPGRLNETWFKVDRPGVYFGQCSELCGARHGYMPIAVEVVSKAQYAQWVASKGGTMPGAKPAAVKTAAATPSSSLTVAQN
ncbi:cytochrome c oxidase subunit II [Sphingomonas sp. AP4-R1]|uniref:cytochrome c oxidase subunit II n=1 Tax=Sphingomonas sp. AP4-R1 TaxID=2735134 RepID=UPI0020A380C5|nr:cytochrome c oxidase subunit II [Sphingomonas sp. AP4-R1]